MRTWIDPAWRIEEISFAPMAYVRPRAAGSNARLGPHGPGGDVPVVRMRVAGVDAFGWSRITREQARLLLGRPLVDLFRPEEQATDLPKKRGPQPRLAGQIPRSDAAPVEFPLLDALGRILRKPVYELAGGKAPVGGMRIPVYDTSIYFDDLELPDDAGAAALLCREVEEGMARGHRNFKIKVGRGAMWMDLEAGMRRDVAIVHAIRRTAGPDAVLMADANNGYNPALTRRFLEETEQDGLYWMEEPFHEDESYLGSLQAWMRGKGLATRIADGEGAAAPRLVEWAGKGLVDVLQYDLREYGFLRWVSLGRRLDALGVLSAPHNYGGFYGNYAQCHLGTAIRGLCFAEWDEAQVDGIDTRAYRLADGQVGVPTRPGFGLELDKDKFEHACMRDGWRAKR